MRLEVPDHVVYREFAGETVVLNLDSGQYYGLNPTAAAMLEAVRAHGTVEGALAGLQKGLDAPAATLRADLERLCGELTERGIVVACE